MSKCKSNFTRIIRYLLHFDFFHGTFSHFLLPIFNLFFSTLCIRTLAPGLLTHDTWISALIVRFPAGVLERPGYSGEKRVDEARARPTGEYPMIILEPETDASIFKFECCLSVGDVTHLNWIRRFYFAMDSEGSRCFRDVYCRRRIRSGFLC